MTLPAARRVVVAALVFAAVAWALTAMWNLDTALNPYVVPNTAFFLTGALVAWRRPNNPLAWLLLAFGPLDALGAALIAGSTVAEGSAATWARALSGASQTFATMLIPLLLLLFPDGGLPSRRWRPVLALAVALLVVMPVAALLTGEILAGSTDPAGGPLGVAASRVGAVMGRTLYLLPLLMVAAGVSLVVRRRRASGVERQQLKVLLAAGTAFLLIAITMPFTPVTGGGSTGDVIIATCLVVLPVAIGVALLRYRLWDVDLVLSRSLVVLLLTALVTAVYATVVVGGGRLVQRGTDDLTLQVLATALIAVAFAPAREVATRVANRLVFGRRATPYEVLEQLTDQMGGSVAESEALDRVAALLAAGTGAQRTTVWLRTKGDLRAVAVWPADRSAPPPLAVTAERLPAFEPGEVVYPVRDGDELLGALTLATARDEGLTAVERRVVEDMVSSVGILLRRVRLDAELTARVAELRASRQRLVTAQDGARRHLERDLHDGAQQQLVAVKVRLGIARSLAVREGDEQLAERLAVLAAQTDDAVDELRAIAHGIYPPLLAAEGLPAAFTALARRQPVPVTISADGIGRHPENVEATAYFAMARLLDRAVAQGVQAVDVEVREADGALHVDVRTPGVAPDIGALVDRVDAAGGAVAVVGETVTIRLPAGVAA